MRRVAMLGLAVLAVVATGCLDPTTGRPPPPGAAVPAFQSSVTTVTASDLPSTWRAGCPVGPADLRRVTVTHWGFDGSPHQGELIVHRDSAWAMVGVFHRLYDVRFQIRRMHRVDDYGGSDGRSMDADNTSGFNCRYRTGSTTVWSEHSFGRAVDINPVENPYVNGSTVLPSAGRPYADRSLQIPGMIHTRDLVVDAFAFVGWKWGGSWTSPIDYQHFSASGQ